MSVPQDLQNLDLDIENTDAYLDAVIVNQENGDYTYSVVFESEFADWSGKIDVPANKVSKKLREDFASSSQEVDKLGKDVQKLEEDLGELLGEKKSKGEEESTVGGYVKLKRRKKVIVTFGTRIVRKAKPSRYALELKVEIGGQEYGGMVLVPEKDELLGKLLEEAKKTAALKHR